MPRDAGSAGVIVDDEFVIDTAGWNDHLDGVTEDEGPSAFVAEDLDVARCCGDGDVGMAVVRLWRRERLQLESIA
jgi:hypothetical protein